MEHTQYGSHCKQRDVVGMLLDLEKYELRFFINGVDQGIAFTKNEMDFNEDLAVIQ